jgi:hypothetical protein
MLRNWVPEERRPAQPIRPETQYSSREVRINAAASGGVLRKTKWPVIELTLDRRLDGADGKVRDVVEAGLNGAVARPVVYRR